MTEETVSYSYQKTSGQWLKEMLALLPPMALGGDKATRYVEFQVLDGLNNRVLFIEQYVDNHAVDQASEGVSKFGPHFRKGIILPDNEIMLASDFWPWRMTVMEYHGGWYITSLNSFNMRAMEMQVSPALWGSTVAGIDDAQLRSQVLSEAMTNPSEIGNSYEDMLHFVHEAHRKHTYRPKDGRGNSIIQFSV